MSMLLATNEKSHLDRRCCACGVTDKVIACVEAAGVDDGPDNPDGKGRLTSAALVESAPS